VPGKLISSLGRLALNLIKGNKDRQNVYGHFIKTFAEASQPINENYY